MAGALLIRIYFIFMRFLFMRMTFFLMWIWLFLLYGWLVDGAHHHHLISCIKHTHTHTQYVWHFCGTQTHAKQMRMPFYLGIDMFIGFFSAGKWTLAHTYTGNHGLHACTQTNSEQQQQQQQKEMKNVN